MAKRGRPKKVKVEQNGHLATETIVPDTKPRKGFDLVLGVRRIRSGPFSGLWELTELIVDPDNAAVFRVLTDANTKSLVVTAAAKRLSTCI